MIKTDPWEHGGWQAFVAVTEVMLDRKELYTLSILLCSFFPDGSV